MNPIENPEDRFKYNEERPFSPGGKEALYNDFPFWGLMTFASACLIFAVNINSWFVGIALPGIILMSLLIKVRFKISGTIELILAAILSIILLIFMGGPTLKSFNIGSLLNHVSYFLNFFLIFLIIINTYRVKNANDYYMSFIASIIFVVISALFSPWKPDVKNMIAFTFYGISTVFYFIDLLFMSYPVAKTKKTFKKYQALPFIFALLLVVVLSLYFAKYSKKFEPSILKFLIQRTNALPSYSFSSVSRLGQKDYMYKSNKIVMRIMKKRGAKNVRAKIYNKYENSKWSAESEKKSLKPVSGGFPLKAKEIIEEEKLPVYSIIPDDLEPKNNDGYHLEKYFVFFRKNDLVYYPDNAVYTMIKKPYLEKDDLGNVSISGAIFDEFELLTVSKLQLKDPAKEGGVTEQDLVVPEKMQADFRKIALEVTKNKEGSMKKAFAMQMYFQENFKYKLGIDLEHPDMDPVHEFLVYKKPAHCEYYASAMTLMLRSIGIPARYTVGFIVHTYNKQGGYYIVRERDAHAWVLAYNPEKGWVAFDPTPPSAVPRGETAANDWFDYIKYKLRIFMSYIKSGSFKKLLKELFSLILVIIKNLYFWILSAIIILIIIAVKKGWIRLLLRQKAKADDKLKMKEGEKVYQLQLILVEFDEILKKAEIERPLNLTLIEFIDYLKEKNIRDDYLSLCNEFLLYYAQIRYAANSILDQDLKKAENLLNKIKASHIEGKSVFRTNN